ncbi:MAG: pilus assembly protein TadG-related protein [Hyphomicrobiales bacterium]
MKNLARAMRHWRKDESASIAIISGVSIAVIIVAAGVAVDYGTASTRKQELQHALDSAVLAGVVTPPHERDQTSTAYFNNNFAASSVTLTGLNFVTNGDGTYTGTVSGTIKTTLAGVFGVDSMSVQAKATAKKLPGNVPCMLALDPRKWYGLRLEDSSQFVGSGCEVNVHSDRIDASAGFRGSTSIDFKRVCLKGGTKTPIGNLEEFCQVADDPFAGRLPKVTTGACNYSNKIFSSANVTLSPGTYCGVTQIASTVQTAVFSPGLYVFQGGGALVLNGKSMTGNGVTFYFTDPNPLVPSISMDAVTGSAFSAPTSGRYKDILMFNTDGQVGAGIRIKNVQNQNWTGIVYLPTWDAVIEAASQWTWNANVVVNSMEIRSASKWAIAPIVTGYSNINSKTEVMIID